MVKKVENNNSLSESNSVFRRFDSYSFESDQRFWNGISKLRSSGQFDVLVAAFPSERDFMLSLQLKYYAKYLCKNDSLFCCLSISLRSSTFSSHEHFFVIVFTLAPYLAAFSFVIYIYWCMMREIALEFSLFPLFWGS